ncbi:MAG: pyruvate phosphate dikinase [Planctomycetes bacterium]|nr:pyruvate phosphate dikinase [Planctomycetota bacterium]
MKFVFGTKTETLERIAPLLSFSHVPELCHFTVDQWKVSRDSVLQEIQSRFEHGKIIVRSSALTEDGASFAMAGMYDSIPDIQVDDVDSLSNAINTVISSYEKSHHDNSDQHQVLVQPMIKDVSMSGVLFTQDLNTGAPYYVINYDDESGQTDTVTSGKENSNRTLLVHRESVANLCSERFKAVLKSIQEIEKLISSDSLDVEFALDKNNKVYLFQVRQITTKPNWNRGITIQVNDAIKRIGEFIKGALVPRQGLSGKTTLFGRMPDWNPAEMIGTAPRPLALSLYQRLITDCVWRQARSHMGYFEPQGSRLMVSLSGQPYIDVRLSFNSFLPANLDTSIRDKLVDAWLKRLSEHKELHDKVEFDVAITALTFDFDTSIEEQMPGILTEHEKSVFQKSLFILTNNLLTGKTAPIEEQLDKIELLQQRRGDMISKCQCPDLAVVAGLLEDCISLGTIPFSILARHAFIAKSFLRSFLRCGLADESAITSFQKSTKTVAGEVVNDLDNLMLGDISPEEFMDKYGHLRPGTYDILSKRYDQREDLINGNVAKPVQRETAKDFSFSSGQLNKITKLLKQFGFTLDAHELISYISEAVIAREYAKFVFTRNISDALEIIAAWGENIGLSREELSYLRIDDILDTINISRGRTLEQHLRNISLDEKKKHEITLALRLPYLIETPEDVAIVPLLFHKPNFITQKTVRGSYVFLDGENENIPEIAGQVVLIEGADPGFDWIFSRPILGLITKFGGANSHMAIRCAEFGLPAAIGCGEQIFDRILRSRFLELNCSEGRIESIEA